MAWQLSALPNGPDTSTQPPTPSLSTEESLLEHNILNLFQRSFPVEKKKKKKEQILNFLTDWGTNQIDSRDFISGD